MLSIATVVMFLCRNVVLKQKFNIPLSEKGKSLFFSYQLLSHRERSSTSQNANVKTECTLTDSFSRDHF